MSALNTNTLSIDYTLEENTGAARTAQIYTEVDGEIVDVMNITQAASAAYENPSGGSDLPDIEIDMSGETQAAIDAIKAKIANYRSLLNTSAYTNAKNQVIETINYYKGLLDIDLTDAYGCVSVDESHPLEIINSYYFELNYLLENYEKVQNFLAEITGNISDLKISSINKTLDNLEDDYNNLKDITEETSKITQSLIDSLSSDNLISPDEQLTLKLKLDEIVTEYVSVSNSVNALIAAYTEASKPKVDENGEEHKEAFIAEDVAEYLEKLNTAFNDYKKNYNKACNILIYYTAADTSRDEFGNITIVPDYDLEDLPAFYEVRQTLLDVYYEANSYYTTYNRFGSKTTWIGDNGIYSGTIMADNLQGWCIQGLTVQSGINEELPKDLEWYKYNGTDAVDEATAFTKITADYRDENGNPVVSGPTWQIYKDGTGHLAKGGIRWNKDEVIFGDSTKISITREDGSTEIVPLGKNFSDMDDKIDAYLSEWQNDNIISYSEQRSMASVATEITAEHKQITGSVNNLINNLKDAQNKIDVDATDAVIDTYINSLDVTDYLDATNKALAVIAYYTQEDADGTFRSVTGSVEISADYPLSTISDYYDARESLVESYNKAADFYTNNVNSILAGVMQDVKVNAETIKGYIETWASDKVVSPAELAEFRVLYNTISSERSDILVKVSKLDKQYEEYIASINEANTSLKTMMQDYKDGLNTDAYDAESDDVLATLNYYLKYKASEDDINTYGEGFIPINIEYPLEDIYEYYDVKDALVEKYNLAFAAYTTYTNSELVERINDISTTNENIDKFIADWSDNNNVDPAEQVQMEYIKKEIIAEEPVIKAAAALTLENVLDVEDIIINNGIEDDILLNTTSNYKKSLDITVATSDIAIYDAKKNLALDVISYYTSSTNGSFVDIVAEKPLSAIDDYYKARETVKDAINNANSFCTSFNSGNFKDILNKLSDTNEKITSYIESWLDDNGIDPAEQTEMEYVKKEIVAETPTLVVAAGIALGQILAIEKKIQENEIVEDDEILTNIESIKTQLDTTAFDAASTAAQRVINYYVNGSKDSNGFIKFNDKYPLSVIDDYYTERENLTQAINTADSLCSTYNDIVINNVIGSLSDTDTKIADYIKSWKDDKVISPAERNELGRILAEILVEEAGVISSVNDMKTRLNNILTTDADKLVIAIKNEINDLINGLDTTAFKSAADNAETVLTYYTTTENIDDNGFINIIEDQKLEVVEQYYKERETVKAAYNAALSFYNEYNRSSISILEKDLADYAEKMEKYIDDVTSDGFVDASERRQFKIYKAEIASQSASLDAAALALRTDLNALARMTGDLYISEINKHITAIDSSSVSGYAKAAIKTLDYYINATPDENNLVKIDGAQSLDSVNEYYAAAAKLNGALNAANSFYAKTVGEYSNTKITVAQEKLQRLESDLRALENLQGTDSEEVKNWIAAWIDEGTLNSEELKELRLKADDIIAEHAVVEPAVTNTLAWLNDHSSDTMNNATINEYLSKLNQAHNEYESAYSNVVNTVNYYFSEEAEKDPDTNCVIISTAYPLDVFATYVSKRANVVTINNDASSFVTTYNRFGSKLTKLTDEGVYTGTLSADKIDGWCLNGLTFQSAATTTVPSNVTWYKYNPSAAHENDAFTEQKGGSGAPRWQLYKDGTGYVADGQIAWSGDTVTLGDKVTLSWLNVDGGKTYVDNQIGEQSKDAKEYADKQKTALETALNNVNATLTDSLDDLEDRFVDYQITAAGNLADLKSRVSALEVVQDNSTDGITDLINKISSGAYLSPADIEEIRAQTALIDKNYGVLIANLDEVISDYTKWNQDNLNNKVPNATDLELPNAITDLNNAKTAVAAAYNKAIKVCKYYLGEGEYLPETDEAGFVTVDNTAYPLSAIVDYDYIENEAARIATQYITFYTTYNRFGSKTTWIGKDGIYSGTIMGDNIVGGTIKGLTITDAAGSSFTIDTDGTFTLGEDAIRYDGSDVYISGNNVNIDGNVNINGEAIANGIENASDTDKARIGELVADFVDAGTVVTDVLETKPDKTKDKIHIQDNYIHCINNSGDKNLIISSDPLNTTKINKVLGTGFTSNTSNYALSNITLSNTNSGTYPYANSDVWYSHTSPRTLGYILKGSSVNVYVSLIALNVKSERYDSSAALRQQIPATDWKIQAGSGAVPFVVGGGGGTTSHSGGCILIYKKNDSGAWEEYDTIWLTGSWYDAITPWQSSTSNQTPYYKTQGTGYNTINIDEDGEYGVLLGFESNAIRYSSAGLQSISGLIKANVTQAKLSSYTEIGRDGIITYDGTNSLRLTSEGVEMRSNSTSSSSKFFGIKITSTGMFYCNGGSEWVAWNPAGTTGTSGSSGTSYDDTELTGKVTDLQTRMNTAERDIDNLQDIVSSWGSSD